MSHEACSSPNDMRAAAEVVVDYAKWGLLADQNISPVLDALEMIRCAFDFDFDFDFDFRAAPSDGKSRQTLSSAAFTIDREIRVVLLAAWCRARISIGRAVSPRALAALANCSMTYLRVLLERAKLRSDNKVSAADATKLLFGRAFGF
jgi:hypothetical protein